jgi:hypothetical protein
MTAIMDDGRPEGQVSKGFATAARPNPEATRRGRTPAPFSLRLSEEERAALEAQAGGQPLGAYIRARLLEDAGQARRSYRRPVKDDETLARLLAELGQARLANNLNQLAKAANTGSLPITPETVQAILTACQDVRAMRACLMAALGFRPEDRP